MRLGTSTAFLLALTLAHQLPNDPSSFKFVVLGDSGTGKKSQYELADQMTALRERFDYRTVMLLGDNVQGGDRPRDFVDKFEAPYRRLLDQGVTFRAVLGHDDVKEQKYYKLFNMHGDYYTFSPAADIQVFALDSTSMSPAQVKWLDERLQQSTSAWKIAALHHAPYSSARRRGPDATLRRTLEPLFVRHHVSVVFSAHEKFYERLTPQKDITYFVVGSGGSVRPGDIDRSSGLTASGFDTDLAFLAAEVAGDTMNFTAISRDGKTVDSGRVLRRK
jgi:hypothetical protein